MLIYWLKNLFRNRFLIKFSITKSTLENSLFDIYPSRTPLDGTDDFEEIKTFWKANRQPSMRRSSNTQMLMQLAALATTKIVSILAGLLVGLIIECQLFSPLKSEQIMDDEMLWVTSSDLSEVKENELIYENTSVFGNSSPNESFILQPNFASNPTSGVQTPNSDISRPLQPYQKQQTALSWNRNTKLPIFKNNR